MRVLVVYCHPCPESFTAAVRDTVLAALERGGHAWRLVDLYAESFEPAMGADERRGYHDEGQNTAPVAEHVERLRWAEALLFVYPTWWFGLPAMLKGWLDRVLVPGFAFEMPTARQGPRPGLTHIRALGVFTTCGATRLNTWLMGAPGRRTLLRGLRSACHPLTRTTFVAIYKMDSVTQAQRQRHLARVARRVERLIGSSESRHSVPTPGPSRGARRGRWRAPRPFS